MGSAHQDAQIMRVNVLIILCWSVFNELIMATHMWNFQQAHIIRPLNIILTSQHLLCKHLSLQEKTRKNNNTKHVDSPDIIWETGSL